MTAADAAAAAEIDRMAFSQPWGEADFQRYAEDANTVALVAGGTEPAKGSGAAGAVCGFVLLSCAADEGDILKIAVHPDARRRGVGGALTEAAIRTAQQLHGTERVFLEVRESNTAAREMYRGCGFEEIGIRRNYYRDPAEDAVLMKWNAKD